MYDGQQDALKRKVVHIEVDPDHHKRICAKHQGKLKSMTQDDPRHAGSTYMVHGGNIPRRWRIGQLRNNASVHVVNKMLCG